MQGKERPVWGYVQSAKWVLATGYYDDDLQCFIHRFPGQKPLPPSLPVYVLVSLSPCPILMNAPSVQQLLILIILNSCAQSAFVSFSLGRVFTARNRFSDTVQLFEQFDENKDGKVSSAQSPFVVVVGDGKERRQFQFGGTICVFLQVKHLWFYLHTEHHTMSSVVQRDYLSLWDRVAVLCHDAQTPPVLHLHSRSSMRNSLPW